MPTPGGSAVVKDVTNTTPAAQFWDPVAQAYAYRYGDTGTGQSYETRAPITPTNSAAVGNAYRIGFAFKASAGKFYGAAGQYKGATAVWIMAFDSASAPATNAVPLIATAVPPATSSDINWVLDAGGPITFATGLYIGISTTGGLFTATASADFTGIALVV